MKASVELRDRELEKLRSVEQKQAHRLRALERRNAELENETQEFLEDFERKNAVINSLRSEVRELDIKETKLRKETKHKVIDIEEYTKDGEVRFII